MSTNTRRQAGASEFSLTARETLNNPEWARFPKAGERLNGFTRSVLYDLAAQGKIVTRSLKRPGQTRGIRFVNIASLAELLRNAPS
jgi:hypothetical protein